ncbi:ligand-effect modulator 3 family [Scheffersomyces coipomensis]|uniref:ligand-effect modulator 3 family n=1 Tax=Scheffersomyces coipomensis TaxID=1788519 RepID=UPI00315D5C58
MNFLRRRRNSEDEDDEDDNIALGNTNSNIHKSRKPPNTAFRQQRLKAWQPILTPKSVIPLLFIIAIIFTPLGISILYTTYNVELVSVDYSKCNELATDTFASIPSSYTNYHFRSKNTDPEFQWKITNSTDSFGDLAQTCQIQFSLPVDLNPPIFLYYKLTNFYQNHRKYVSSYDIQQLRGNAVPAGSITDYCKPLLHLGEGDDQKLIYPCGLIANSYFNDTFSSPVLLNAKNGDNNETYELTNVGISWASDIQHKFATTKYTPDQVVPPPNWYKMFPEGYNETNMPDLHTWELLQNWMRTAGLPTFYKLYGKNQTEVLTSGTYEISIGLNYPVSIFGGTKSVVITTNSIFGGRNLSLGIIYIIIAIIALVLGVAFLIQHLIKPRRIGDHNFLQGNNNAFAGSSGVTNFRDQL